MAANILLWLQIALTALLLVRGLARSVFAFERNVRTIQVVLLASLMALIRYYSVQIGRNLRGLITGYLFFVGFNVLVLGFRSHIGTNFQVQWQYLQQASYLIAL